MQKHEKRCPEKRNVMQKLKNERNASSTPVADSGAPLSANDGLAGVNLSQPEHAPKRKSAPDEVRQNSRKRLNPTSGDLMDSVITSGATTSVQTFPDRHGWESQAVSYPGTVSPHQLASPTSRAPIQQSFGTPVPSTLATLQHGGFGFDHFSMGR